MGKYWLLEDTASTVATSARRCLIQERTLGRPVASMHNGRAGHTATLMPSGNVLVTGGDLFLNYQTSAEVYDPNLEYMDGSRPDEYWSRCSHSNIPYRMVLY